MKFALHTPDLHIIAENGKDIAELCNHFRLPIDKHIDDLVKGAMAYVSRGAKHPWFELGATVPFDFLKPYYDRLKVITGYDGAPFTVSDRRLNYCSNRGHSLCHTHIVTHAEIDEKGYHAQGCIQSQDWNGRTAAERAPRQFNEYLREQLGDHKREPEMIQKGNHAWYPNPNYLKYHAPEPAASSEAVFEVIFQHWLDTSASLAQIDFYEKAQACYDTVVKSTSLAAALLKTVREFHTDGYKTTVTFEQFKELDHV